MWCSVVCMYACVCFLGVIQVAKIIIVVKGSRCIRVVFRVDGIMGMLTAEQAKNGVHVSHGN